MSKFKGGLLSFDGITFFFNPLSFSFIPFPWYQYTQSETNYLVHVSDRARVSKGYISNDWHDINKLRRIGIHLSAVALGQQRSRN